MTTYNTLTGSITTDGIVDMPHGDSYYRVVYEGDKPMVGQTLMSKDVDKLSSMSTMTNEDGMTIGLHYSEQRRFCEVWISNGHGVVVVLPGHPRYESYPQVEEEVDPTGTLGKVVAEWDINDICPVVKNNSDLPF